MEKPKYITIINPVSGRISQEYIDALNSGYEIISERIIEIPDYQRYQTGFYYEYLMKLSSLTKDEEVKKDNQRTI